MYQPEMEQLNVTAAVKGGDNCDSIDDFRNQVYSTAYSFITVLGLLGNGFALVVLIRTRRRSSPFDIYMLNLAVSDLLCVMSLPLRVMYYVRKGQWDLGDVLCRISSYTLYVNLYSGIYFMAAMSITRFLAIVYPVQNLRLVTKKHARLVCVGIWVFICLSSSPFLMSGQMVDPSTNKTKCFEPPSESKATRKLAVMNYLALVFGLALPFLVILLCYAGIIRALMSRNHAARRQRHTGDRAIRMIVIVLLTFLVSFMPYHVQRTIHLSFMARDDVTCPETVAMQKSVVVTLCLAAANSCFDPLLYFFSGEGFRRRINSMHRSARANSERHASMLKSNAAQEKVLDNGQPGGCDR